MNKEELYRNVLWKTKRALEDIKFDPTIDHYVMSERLYELVLDRINTVLCLKAKGK